MTILEPFTVLDAPALAFQLFNKKINQNSRIKTFRCRRLDIHRKKPGVAHYDGEPVMLGKDITIDIMEKGLHVIVPSKIEMSVRDLAFNALQRAQDYINGLKQLGEQYVPHRFAPGRHNRRKAVGLYPPGQPSPYGPLYPKSVIRVQSDFVLLPCRLAVAFVEGVAGYVETKRQTRCPVAGRKGLESPPKISLYSLWAV